MDKKVKYSHVIGLSTPIGWVWKIEGDNLSAFTKKDCESRIRSLFNAGQIDRATRNYLLNDLSILKRGT